MWYCIICGEPDAIGFGPHLSKAPVCKKCIQLLFYDDVEKAQQFIHKEVLGE